MMLYLRCQVEEYAFSEKKWGSAAALRRLAAALVVAAEEADDLIALRRGESVLGDGSGDAHSVGEAP